MRLTIRCWVFVTKEFHQSLVAEKFRGARGLFSQFFWGQKNSNRLLRKDEAKIIKMIRKNGLVEFSKQFWRLNEKKKRFVQKAHEKRMRKRIKEERKISVLSLQKVVIKSQKDLANF